MSLLHDAAARGYEAGAEAYERGRPEYPPPAVEHLVRSLGVGPGSALLDLGAGTGKLTRQLATTGARLVAVEPVLAMRSRLEERLAAVTPVPTILEGTAEAIPLEAASVDAVIVAQAFHWFDGDRALAEIHRVLRPGGSLGLVWNVRDESVDWVLALTEVIDRREAGAGAPRYRTGLWRKAFERSSLFTPLVAASFPHAQVGPSSVVVDRVASISFVAALAPGAREDILAEVRRLLATHPETRGRSELALPYRTETFVAQRVTTAG